MVVRFAARRLLPTGRSHCGRPGDDHRSSWDVRMPAFGGNERLQLWEELQRDMAHDSVVFRAIKYMAKLHFERDIWQAYFPPARSVLDSELVDFNLARPAAEMPLPPDVKVEGPAESLPPASGGLVGKWTGTWSNGVNHVLVVERIDSSSTATVVFARDRAPALNIDRPFYARFTAAVSNGELQFKIRNGLATVSYVLTEEGSLSGKLISESGTPALIRMSRFE